jgi:type I restriction enzyme S subunit
MLNTQLTSIINAGVRNDGLLNVPAASFFNLLVSFPPKEEQIQLGKIFDTADRELAFHRQHLEVLRNQKRGLMRKLLTGEVRVPTD